jgi:phytoene dehydrogenase-like protein
MGTISKILYDVAKEHGILVQTKKRVTQILPGEGVRLESGELLRSKIVVSNADPRSTLNLLGYYADPAWKRKVEAFPQVGCSGKVNVALRELPNFKSRPGTVRNIAHMAQLNLVMEPKEWIKSLEACKAGRIPDHLWLEGYFQTATDMSVSPHGLHHMSIFIQPLPYNLEGPQTWDQAKSKVLQYVVKRLQKVCSNIPDAIVAIEVLYEFSFSFLFNVDLKFCMYLPKKKSS